MRDTLAARSRMDAVQAPIIPIVGKLIRDVPGTISLGQGVVHYGPPPAALDAVRERLTDPLLHQYGPADGWPPLVERIARKLRDENGIQAGVGTAIMVTAGANMAFMHAVFAVTRPGDEIILPVPFYFNHEMAIEMAGCRPVPVPTDSGHQLDLQAIQTAITPRTRAVVTVSPNNPSGAVFDPEALRALSSLCAARGLLHISDETYEYFTYDGARHVSPAAFPGAADHTIAIYSLSKAFGFAGWRIGYMAYPARLSAAMTKSQDTILICPTLAAQVAAAAALDVGRAYCEPHVRELGSIRDVVIGTLARLDPLVQVGAADGAFYCLLKVATNQDPIALNERLIVEHKVAAIPGSAFGLTDGCYLRLAYGALQKATVAEGVGRLVSGLRALCG
ncbi:MAG: pyridoxal phosphate-dependent aminotransferase [Vicinamibacterales bacterium]